MNKIFIFLIIIIFIGSVLRLYYLDNKSFAGDEPGRVAVGKLDTETLLKTSKNVELNPPLHYALIKFTFFFGSSDFILRLPFALVGILTIPVIFLIGKKLFDENTALIATLIFALSPLHIQYSQEVGQYVLFSFFSALSFYFFLCYINNEKFGRIGFIVSSALNLYSHYYAVLFLLPLFVFIFFYRKNLRQNFMISLSAVFVLFAPYLPVFIDQLSLSFSALSPFKVIDAAGIFFVIPFGQSVIHAFKSEIILAIVAAVVLFFLLIPFFRRNYKDTWIILLLIYSVVPVLIGIVLMIKLRSFNYRYFIPVLVPYSLILSAAITKIQNIKIRILCIIVIFSLMLFSLNIYYYSTTAVTAKADWKSVAYYISLNEREADVIYFPVSQDRIAFNHYYKGSLERKTYPFDVNLTDVSYAVLWNYNTTNDTLIQRTENVIKNRERVWIIFPFDDHEYIRIIQDHMDNNYNMLELKKFSPAVLVYLYKLN